jgi:ADP-ribosyl-[dinitrogen reductase] hydrolase
MALLAFGGAVVRPATPQHVVSINDKNILDPSFANRSSLCQIWFGRIGITLCPGIYDRHAATGEWDRDLALDLDSIRDWGAAAVLSLLEPKKLTLLRVERLGEEVLGRKKLRLHLPVVDASIPDQGFERRWAAEGKEIRSLLRRQLDVLVHCRGGLGRAGMIAPRLLTELGMETTKAIATVRTARPGAIETGERRE